METEPTLCWNALWSLLVAVFGYWPALLFCRLILTSIARIGLIILCCCCGWTFFVTAITPLHYCHCTVVVCFCLFLCIFILTWWVAACVYYFIEETLHCGLLQYCFDFVSWYGVFDGMVYIILLREYTTVVCYCFCVLERGLVYILYFYIYHFIDRWGVESSWCEKNLVSGFY